MKIDVACRVTAGMVLALTLSGCSWWGPTRDAPRDSAGAVVSAGTVDANVLKVGDCLNEPDSEEFETVGAIPCSQPHDYQVFHVFTVTGRSYPSDARWDELSDPCYAGKYTEFVGVSYDDSELDAFPFTPTDEAWSNGDRTIQCIIGEEDPTPVTGSLRGARR